MKTFPHLAIQNCLCAILGPLLFHTNFSISLSSSTTNVMGFLLHLREFHLCNIKSCSEQWICLSFIESSFMCCTVMLSNAFLRDTVLHIFCFISEYHIFCFLKIMGLLIIIPSYLLLMYRDAIDFSFLIDHIFPWNDLNLVRLENCDLLFKTWFKFHQVSECPR